MSRIGSKFTEHDCGKSEDKILALTSAITKAEEALVSVRGMVGRRIDSVKSADDDRDWQFVYDVIDAALSEIEKARGGK